MDFQRKECQGFQVLVRKKLTRWLLICVFCKAGPPGILYRVIQPGATIFFLERPDVQAVTRLEAEDSSLQETLQGLRGIIQRMKFAMRFSNRQKGRRKGRPRLRGMVENLLARFETKTMPLSNCRIAMAAFT